jgi:acyl carrier protein
MTTITDGPGLIRDMAQIIQRVAKIEPLLPIGPETRLVEDLSIDSLDLVAIVLQIQEDFDVVIDEDAVQHLCRVGDLAAQVAGPSWSVADGIS